MAFFEEESTTSAPAEPTTAAPAAEPAVEAGTDATPAV